MKKKVAFCQKEGIDFTNVKHILKSKFEYIIDEKSPEIVFCLGGDGTFLDAVSKFGIKPLYIPINFGSLGFYCSWSECDLDSLLDDYKSRNILNAAMIEVELVYPNDTKKFSCLNETTIINNINTQILEIAINDEQLEHFRGTGVCISTPTGSTAYNKSLGGSIISNNKKLYQLTHIAPINNVIYRSVENSIVLDQSEILSFEGNFESTHVSIDRNTYPLKEVIEIKVKLSDKSIAILVQKDNNFYKRVKKAFIG